MVLTNLNNPILFSRTCLLILAQLAKQNNIQILYLLGYIKFFTRFDCTKKCVNLTFCELGSHKISPISAETPVNRLVVRKCQDDVLKCQNIQFICQSVGGKGNIHIYGAAIKEFSLKHYSTQLSVIKKLFPIIQQLTTDRLIPATLVYFRLKPNLTPTDLDYKT